MAERKRMFNLPQNTSNNIGSAGEELLKVESKKDFDFRIIEREKISPNERNQYPMVDIEKLYKSIKREGKLLTWLRVKPVEDGYVLIAGERRYRAISMGLDNGDVEFDKFKVGIPCIVEDKNLSEVDEEIQIITENEEKRDVSESLKRQMISRLDELYKMKNIDAGVNISVPKQVSEQLGIKERQVQRYNAVNNKLIPKLQEAFDNSKISLQKAAQFATMEEAAQELVAELLEEGNKFSKEQIETIVKETKEKEEKLAKEIMILSSKTEEESNTNLDLLKKLSDTEGELERKNMLVKSMLEDIEKESEEIKPDEEKIEAMEKKIDEMKKEALLEEKEKDKIQNELIKKDNELNELKKKLKEKEKEKENKKVELSSEEKQKIKDDFEINNLVEEFEKRFDQLIIMKENYIKKYDMTTQEIESFCSNAINKINELQKQKN